MMFQRYCQTPPLARIRECLLKYSLRPHAMGNKQKRIIQHSGKLVKPEPKQFHCDQILGLKSKALRSAKFDMW